MYNDLNLVLWILRFLEHPDYPAFRRPLFSRIAYDFGHDAVSIFSLALFVRRDNKVKRNALILGLYIISLLTSLKSTDHLGIRSFEYPNNPALPSVSIFNPCDNPVIIHDPKSRPGGDKDVSLSRLFEYHKAVTISVCFKGPCYKTHLLRRPIKTFPCSDNNSNTHHLPQKFLELTSLR